MKVVRAVVPLAIAGAVLTACGSDRQGVAAPSGAGTTAGGKAANVELPSKIDVTKPLTAKPPVKKLAWLANELPTAATYTAGFKQAAAALGWPLQVINFKSASPAPAVQQALDSDVDYIAM